MSKSNVVKTVRVQGGAEYLLRFEGQLGYTMAFRKAGAKRVTYSFQLGLFDRVADMRTATSKFDERVKEALTAKEDAI